MTTSTSRASSGGVIASTGESKSKNSSIRSSTFRKIKNDDVNRTATVSAGGNAQASPEKLAPPIASPRRDQQRYWELRVWMWVLRSVVVPAVLAFVAFSVIGRLIQQCPPEMCLYPGIAVRNGRIVSFVHSISVAAETRNSPASLVKFSSRITKFLAGCTIDCFFKFIGGVIVSTLIGAKPVVFSSPRHIVFMVIAHTVVQFDAVFRIVTHRIGLVKITLGAVKTLYRYRKLGFIATQLLVRTGFLPSAVCFVCCIVSISGSGFARKLISYNFFDKPFDLQSYLMSPRFVLTMMCAATVVATENAVHQL